MKKKQTENWLMNSPFSLKKGISISILIYLSLAAVYATGGKDFIYNRLVYPLEFQLRNDSGRFQPLDPRIKIYAVDQKTMNNVELETIPIQDWISLFKALSKAHPRAVFIDKVFSLPLSKDSQEIRDLNSAISSVSEITAGAIFSPAPITGFVEIVPDKMITETNGLQVTPGYVYGPRSELINAITHIGHTNYEDNGYIKPFIRTTVDKTIPFWSLSVAPFKLEDQKISINNEIIPVDEQNRILVNLASPDSYWKRTLSLVNVMKKARSGEALDEIKSNQIVIILTGMYQGTTAVKSTPAGSMPGGFILVEVMNSILGHNWLQNVGHELLFMAAFCLLGLILAQMCGPRKFWSILVAIELALPALGFASFIFYGILLPWAFPAIAFFLSAVVLFAEKSRLTEKKSKALQFSLEGMIENKKLKEIMNHPDKFRLEPKNQVVTVIFIDIVGFSSLAERESPAVVFKHLRDLLALVSDIVHQCGGITDRSLGDGLLCFFGYQFELNSVSTTTHAEQAMNCAVKIQNEILKRDLLALNSGSPIFPLRIGVNTGEVYIGDLGGSHKIDFTIIGHCVNVAQRMENACENYHIMCGPTTHDGLDQKNLLFGSLMQKYVAVKHHAELVEAYELDPFFDDVEAQKNRDLLCRKIDKASRIEMRWPVAADTRIRVKGEWGEGLITNFSLSGLEIRTEKYIGKGAVLTSAIFSEDGNLEKILKESNVEFLTAEVRWSRHDDEAFRLGLKFKNLNEEQKNSLLSCFRAKALRAS